MAIKQNYLSEFDKDRLSLVKLKGSNIKDIVGWVENEFGDPVFKMSKIIFEDGIEFWCEGEHDIPYVTDIDEELLQSINDEEE